MAGRDPQCSSVLPRPTGTQEAPGAILTDFLLPPFFFPLLLCAVPDNCQSLGRAGSQKVQQAQMALMHKCDLVKGCQHQPPTGSKELQCT